MAFFGTYSGAFLQAFSRLCSKLQIDSLIVLLFFDYFQNSFYYDLNIELRYTPCRLLHSYALFCGLIPPKPVPDSKGADAGSPTTKHMTVVLSIQLQYCRSLIFQIIEQNHKPILSSPNRAGEIEINEETE